MCSKSMTLAFSASFRTGAPGFRVRRHPCGPRNDGEKLGALPECSAMLGDSQSPIVVRRARPYYKPKDVVAGPTLTPPFGANGSVVHIAACGSGFHVFGDSRV